MKYWNSKENDKDELVQEYRRLYEKYIPRSGSTFNSYMDMMLALSRLMHDYYNNGWGANDKTAELDYLQEVGYVAEITYRDLACLKATATSPDWDIRTAYLEEYMDAEMDELVTELLEAEKKGLLDRVDIIDDEDNFFTSEKCYGNPGAWRSLMAELDENY